MPTAQSKANLRYYHRRSAEEPEYKATLARSRMERYYLNVEEEREKARMRYYAKRERERMMNVPAEKTEEIPA